MKKQRLREWHVSCTSNQAIREKTRLNFGGKMNFWNLFKIIFVLAMVVGNENALADNKIDPFKCAELNELSGVNKSGPGVVESEDKELDGVDISFLNPEIASETDKTLSAKFAKRDPYFNNDFQTNIKNGQAHYAKSRGHKKIIRIAFDE